MLLEVREYDARGPQWVKASTSHIKRGKRVRESATSAEGRYVGTRKGIVWIAYADDYRQLCRTFDGAK